MNPRNKSLFSKRKTKSSSFQYFFWVLFFDDCIKICVFSSRLPLSRAIRNINKEPSTTTTRKCWILKSYVNIIKKKTKSRTQQNHNNIKCVNISKKEEHTQYKRAEHQVMCAESIFCILRNFLHLSSIIIPMDWKLYILQHRCNHLWIMIWFFSNFQRQYFTNVTFSDNEFLICRRVNLHKYKVWYLKQEWGFNKKKNKEVNWEIFNYKIQHITLIICLMVGNTFFIEVSRSFI